MPFNHSRNTRKVCEFTTKLQKLQILKQTELFIKSEFKEPTEAKCLASPNRVKSSLYWNTQDKVEGRRRRWRRRNANRHLCRFSSSAEMTKDKHCPGASVRHRLSLAVSLKPGRFLAEGWYLGRILAPHNGATDRDHYMIVSLRTWDGNEMKWSWRGNVVIDNTPPPLLQNETR